MGHNAIIFNDFDYLRTEREVIDTAIQDWADNDLTEDILESDLPHRTITNPRDIVRPMALCVAHFFNHQTHHRGQVTTLLSQCGIDPGVTDMIAMP